MADQNVKRPFNDEEVEVVNQSIYLHTQVILLIIYITDSIGISSKKI